MSGLRLLYLNTHRLTAYGWRRGQLWQEDVFDPTPNGLERFATYLRERSTCSFRLLANVGEEGHQIELIPFLRGKDRATLVERKQGQIFFGTSLIASRSLGYEKSKRKNERLLLSALTNQAHFQPWLNALAACDTPLAGLYSISQLSGQLLGRLGKIPPRCLLLTMQDHSLRESFLVDGVTVFSRMAPLVDGSIAGMAAGMAAEAGKMHQYLVGQRQIGRSDTLPVIVLGHASAHAAIRTACIDTAGMHFVLHDIADATAQIGLRQSVEDSRCDPLFLHLLATETPKEQFLPSRLRRDYRIHQARRGLLAGGIAALACAAVFAAWNLLIAHSNRQETQALRRDESLLTRRYQEMLATFPQLGVENDVLRQFAQRYHNIKRLHREPAAAYRHVSQALDSTPSIELEAIEWRLEGPENHGKPQASAGLLEVSEEVLILRGAIRLPADASPRQVVAIFDEFVKQLTRTADIQATVLQQPFDTEPGRTLKGSTDEQAAPKAPSFSLRLAWRLPT